MSRPLSENAPIWAQRVTLLRKQRDIPRSKLAELFGKTETTVGHYFCGRVQPSFGQLHLLASYLNITLDSLLRDEPDLSVEDARSYELRVPLLRWDEVGVVDLNPSKQQIVSPCPVTEVAFAVKAENNDAAPVFLAGDMLIVDYRGEIPSGSFVLYRADGQSEPLIRMYVNNQAGEVLYPVEPSQDSGPVSIKNMPLFLQKIVAKVTLY